MKIKQKILRSCLSSFMFSVLSCLFEQNWLSGSTVVGSGARIMEFARTVKASTAAVSTDSSQTPYECLLYESYSSYFPIPFSYFLNPLITSLKIPWTLKSQEYFLWSFIDFARKKLIFSFSGFRKFLAKICLLSHNCSLFFFFK